MRTKRILATALLAAGSLIGAAVGIALASPPSNVSATVLARGTFDSFKVMSNPEAGGLFKAQAKSSIDVVVRQHAYEPGDYTGWHAHPYPVFVTVKEGTLTFYEYDDPTCTPIVVSAGEGYVDSGRGHMAVNESGVSALDVSVILAPVGGGFRTELAAPNPYCGF